MVATFSDVKRSLTGLLQGDNISNELVSVGDIVGVAVPEWFRQLSATVGDGSHATKPIIRNAVWAHNESFALYSIGNNLSVASTAMGKSWLVCSTNSAISCTAFSVEDDTLNVWIGESNGRLHHYFMNLMDGTVFSLLASVQSPSTVLAVLPVPWTPMSPCFFCFVLTSNSITLYGYAAHEEMKSSVVFDLPMSKCCKLISAQIVDTAYGPKTLLAAHYESLADGKVAVAVVTVDCRAATIVAEQNMLKRLTATKLEAPVHLHRALLGAAATASSPKKGIFFAFGGKSESEAIVFSTIISAHMPVFPVYSGADMFAASPSFAVVLLTDKGSIHLIQLRTPQAMVVEAVKKVDLSSHQLYSDVIALPSPVCYSLFNAQGALTESYPQVSVPGNEQPLWQACVEHSLALPSRRAAVRKLAEVFQSLDERTRLTAVRTIISEALLAAGSPAKIVHHIRATKDEDEARLTYLLADIQRVYDWIAGAGVLGVASLMQDMFSDFSAFLAHQAVPHLLHRGSTHPAAPLLALLKGLDDLSAPVGTVYMLTQALFDRKLATLPARNEKTEKLVDIIAFSVPLDGSLLSRSIVELFFLHEEARILRCIWQLLCVLCKDIYHGFAALIAASGDKDCQLTAHIRRLAASPSDFGSLLPAYLHGPLLADSILQQLPPALQELADSQSPTFSEDAVRTLTGLLLLPFHALQQCKQAVLSEGRYVGIDLAAVRAIVYQSVRPARVATLYYILTSLELATEASTLEMEYDMPTMLSSALQCSPTEVAIVQAMQRIDCCKSVDIAVNAVCRADSMQVIEEFGWDVLPVLAQRLLCTGQLNDAQALMMYLACRQHGFLSTKEGVTAYAAALPSTRQWEIIWLRARMLASKLADPKESAETLSEMTQFMFRWSMRNRVLSIFLQQDFRPLELDVVLKLLTDRAIADTDKALAPSPAVDTLVAFLLQQHRFEEAKEVHEVHEKQVRAHSYALSEEAKKSMQDRRVLLDAHARIPSIPAVNYRMLDHIKEFA